MEKIRQSRLKSNDENQEEIRLVKAIKKKNQEIEIEISKKLKEMKLLYKDFEPLFENDFNNLSDEQDLDFQSMLEGYKEDWFESEFYYKLMYQIQTRKKLDCAIFEVKFKIEDLRKKNNILESELEIQRKCGFLETREGKENFRKENFYQNKEIQNLGFLIS
jgi:hypothetical protein